MGFPTDKATKTWEHAGLQCAIAPAGCNPNGGTAYNGYVRVPQGCDWHGRDYDTINQIMWDNEDDWPEAARLVGGASELTYSNRYGWIGFDTLHAGDRWPEDMLDPIGMPTSPYETAWTMDRLQDAVNAWAEIIAHRSPLWWLLNHYSKAFEDAIQTASTRMKQLAVVAQRIAEIAGSTR